MKSFFLQAGQRDKLNMNNRDRDIFLFLNDLIEASDIAGMTDTADFELNDKILNVSAVNKMITSIKKYFSADMIILRLLSEAENTFKIIDQSGLSAQGQIDLRHVSAELGFVKAIMERNDPILYKDLRCIPSYMRNLYQGEGVCTFIACRIKIEGIPRGILKIYSKTDRRFASTDKRNLKLIANHLGVLLTNLKVYNNINLRHEKIVAVLLKSLEYRDFYTQGHSARVEKLSCLCARQLGLGEKAIHTVRTAASLHDVGKISIPDHVLLKTSPLTEEDWMIIKAHPAKGAELAAGALEENNITSAIMYHHERWDGTGYPNGLSENEIPLISRILAVADSYDAMTLKRVYSDPKSHEEAITELRKESGIKYDPSVIDAFLNCW